MSLHSEARNYARSAGNRQKHDGDPGGIRTRDLDLERVASLARLDDGVPGPIGRNSGMIAGPPGRDNPGAGPATIAVALGRIAIHFTLPGTAQRKCQ